jgi:predicted acetyltransferase
VQIQPETQGAIKPASYVIFGQYREQVVIGNLQTQQSFGLSDFAADIWLAIVKYGNLEQVITALLQHYDVDEATLRVDVSAFINQLCQQGLLIISSFN